MNRQSWLRCLRIAFFGALFIAALGFITMRLWNWLVPEIFHGPEINLLQTYGLLLLSRILFGGFRGGQSANWAQNRKAWRARMAGRMEDLSPEEREKLRLQMQKRCGMGWMRRGEGAEASAAAAN